MFKGVVFHGRMIRLLIISYVSINCYRYLCFASYDESKYYKDFVFVNVVDAFLHHPKISILSKTKLRNTSTVEYRFSSISVTNPVTTTTNSDKVSRVSYGAVDDLLLDTDKRRVRSLKRLHDQNNAIHYLQESLKQHSDSSTLSEAATPPLRTSNENDVVDFVFQSSGGEDFIGAKDKDIGGINEEFVLFDKEQMNSITCNAPAVLLESGPGTGKSSVLVARIAHLLHSGQCSPDRMIVLSFTNKDANALKERALQKLYRMDMEGEINILKMRPRIWSGTIHAFAKGLLSKYGNKFHASGYMLTTASSLRTISTKEMKQRIRKCIFASTQMHSQPLPSRGTNDDAELSLSVMRHLSKNALNDVNQNMDILVQHVLRSIELWKEAGAIQQSSYFIKHLFSKDRHNFKNKDKKYQILAKDCIELAMRLGIPFHVAKLALFIYPEYQVMHYSTGTSDPSDLAGIAQELLLNDSEALKTVRNKLQHVILDEFQDLSISQHSLLQLIITGNAGMHRDDTDTGECLTSKGKTSEISQRSGGDHTFKDHILAKNNIVNKRTGSRKSLYNQIVYDIPKLFCAGDMNQSIYGWRGAAPSLTLDGFRKNFPQSVTVPLGTSYRVPRLILKAANVLLDTEQKKELDDDEDDGLKSFIISPSGKKAITNMLISQQESRGYEPSKQLTEICSKLSVEGGIMSESSSAVYIRGLWDTREESKYVASKILKRSKERIRRCKHALEQISSGRNSKLELNNSVLFDPSDVAIIVRSSTQMKLIEEALKNINIPFISPSTIYTNPQKYSSFASNKPSRHKSQQFGDQTMKPVKLITMHGAKGEEFDDIYLVGWNEGTFPYKSSLSSNRIDEERRLAFVALTRARQHVFITYSFIQRVPYFNQMHDKRYVTEQIKPSRFLFDLIGLQNKHQKANENDINKMLSKDNLSHTGIYWDRNSGIKDYVAGQNLPSYFSKSYRTPNGYSSEWTKQSNQSDLKSFGKDIGVSKSHTQTNSENLRKSPLSECNSCNKKELQNYKEYIESALSEMVDHKKRGSCKKYRPIFRKLLIDLFSIQRGSAIIIISPPFGNTANTNDSCLLLNADKKYITDRPISRCTASQLGHYLLYLIATNK